MKYQLDRAKIAKCSPRLLPHFLACIEVDSSSPHFDFLKDFVIPATPEERWCELLSQVKVSHSLLGEHINERFSSGFGAIKNKMVMTARKCRAAQFNR